MRAAVVLLLLGCSSLAWAAEPRRPVDFVTGAVDGAMEL